MSETKKLAATIIVEYKIGGEGPSEEEMHDALETVLSTTLRIMPAFVGGIHMQGCRIEFNTECSCGDSRLRLRFVEPSD